MEPLVSTSPATVGADSKVLNICLWVAQVMLFVLFGGSGLTKLFTPIPQLSQMMPWAGQYSEHFVRMIGCIDLAGGIGVLLPSLTRIFPRVTVLAALCCVVLQVLAIGFHTSRGEFSPLPLNFVLLPLSIFVLWGRAKKVPIAPRWLVTRQPRNYQS
jgi:hypothetical protein